MDNRIGELRRFAALRRRLNALQQEAYTTARILEGTDWRTKDQVGQVAELQALTNRVQIIDDEINDIEYLLEYHERTMMQSGSLIVTPQTVAIISAMIMGLFLAMTLAAGLLAGAIRVG